MAQYLTYMGNLTQEDLGNSFYYEGRPVLNIILDRLPVSAFLGVQSVLIELFVGLVLGVFAALRT